LSQPGPGGGGGGGNKMPDPPKKAELKGEQKISVPTPPEPKPEPPKEEPPQETLKHSRADTRRCASSDARCAHAQPGHTVHGIGLGFLAPEPAKAPAWVRGSAVAPVAARIDPAMVCSCRSR
jgi:hypothetical protein